MWLILHKYKFLIGWSIKKQSLVNSQWFFLTSGTFPREVANINTVYVYVCVCATLGSYCYPTSLKQLIWHWLYQPLLCRLLALSWWELLPKVRFSLASKTSIWQGTLSAVCLPASIYWEREMNATQTNRFQRARKSIWRYELLLKLYLFGIIWVELDLFLKSIYGFVNVL